MKFKFGEPVKIVSEDHDSFYKNATGKVIGFRNAISAEDSAVLCPFQYEVLLDLNSNNRECILYCSEEEIVKTL